MLKHLIELHTSFNKINDTYTFSGTEVILATILRVAHSSAEKILSIRKLST